MNFVPSSFKTLQECEHGDRILTTDSSEQKEDAMERNVPHGIFFALFPSLFSVIGVLVLAGYLPMALSYNYLRGLRSPIDEVVLVLLGSDLSRLVILASSIIGMMIGLLLSRFVTTKLDVVRKEGEVILSARMHVVLLSWWWFLIWPFQMICILEFIAYGPPTSHFLIDLGFSLTAGYWLAFAIPVLLKYLLLVLHAKSIDSRVKLIAFLRGSGFIKRLQYMTLKVVPDGSDS
jgi:hypothetical protein